MNPKLRRLSEEVEGVGGRLILAEGDVAQKVLEIIKEKGFKTAAKTNFKLAGGLKEALEREGVEVIEGDRANATTIKSAEVGISGVICAIAETGSILVGEDEGKNWQLITSLPGVHIAIIKESDVVPSLEEGFERVRELNVSNFVLITGPSRTADIEKTLVLGVHGPEELYLMVMLERSFKR
jgi:L-lactate dehydrogenase complex protein LldG